MWSNECKHLFMTGLSLINLWMNKTIYRQSWYQHCYYLCLILFNVMLITVRFPGKFSRWKQIFVRPLRSSTKLCKSCLGRDFFLIQQKLAASNGSLVMHCRGHEGFFLFVFSKIPKRSHASREFISLFGLFVVKPSLTNVCYLGDLVGWARDFRRHSW